MRGSIAPLVTPFAPDGSLDLALLDQGANLLPEATRS
jgi:dihydrodipicolinate synthase/N-acetylneuraminate lyase